MNLKNLNKKVDETVGALGRLRQIEALKRDNPEAAVLRRRWTLVGPCELKVVKLVRKLGNGGNQLLSVVDLLVLYLAFQLWTKMQFVKNVVYVVDIVGGKKWVVCRAWNTRHFGIFRLFVMHFGSLICCQNLPLVWLFVHANYDSIQQEGWEEGVEGTLTKKER
ncbi:hypothetical protein T4B_115 [Trichinella pseudospiralis]|uniref:Uncharacterized protein n=1 Tax=Trichinella pseudospiralis TaxID=6337 RepID=A0A0V1IL89_TRIPS|nr:hypothetical protein T4A_573 [Trichinella pseudospiralis]KRZ22901.1 hypothetical protein T4B_115 [Trichinella pseudospiralis]KRZ39748.1 hypothetical protein T4C_1609 [Trichinella pseudospiralis]